MLNAESSMLNAQAESSMLNAGKLNASFQK